MSDPTFWRTQSLEHSLLTLARWHRHVILQQARICHQRIPLRRNMLQQLTFYHWKPWETAWAPQQLKQWQERGGVLIDYSQNLARRIKFCNFIEADAMLMMESPMSIIQAEGWSVGIRHDMVLHEPITWDGHLNTAARKYPGPEFLQQLHDGVRPLACVGDERTELVRSLVYERRLDVPCALMSYREIAEACDMPQDAVAKSVKILQKQNGLAPFVGYVYQFAPRARPDDPNLRRVWDHIKAWPVEHKGRKLIPETGLKALGNRYMVAIRRLNAEGWCEKLPTLYLLPFLPGQRLFIGRMGRSMRSGVAELKALARWVAELPQHPPPAEPELPESE